MVAVVIDRAAAFAARQPLAVEEVVAGLLAAAGREYGKLIPALPAGSLIRSRPDRAHPTIANTCSANCSALAVVVSSLSSDASGLS